ncbi:uncharacterized protein BT62DRAFT_919451 [Guyanagaster necrorhizus]|uniref:Uncharacterized protein n=1 Tax=Guyanagaster necrorhizus TaxID=856835 RepID=A0A9P8AT06_9AGAR|nr:uncharacterized protein BT62DRAFT_919451 [Guyanagaster necrorhizus MCA 3950]KAG7446899.1 hypothetical protein BT62DRAFT_919451 [Guyanagaster necrorhizus MCA 3950]
MADIPPTSPSNFSSNQSIGKHDGHAEGNLNCIAMRHGWSRSFSLPPTEVSSMSYDSLSRALEIHTLNLRPMSVRIYVEHPASSGNWCKIRPFKLDGSLQSVLVRTFFEERLREGVVTTIDIRDGVDRKEETDGKSLRSVGSRILHPQREKTETKQGGGWLNDLISRVKSVTTPPNKELRDVNTDEAEELRPRDAGEGDASNKRSIFKTGILSYFLPPASVPRAHNPPPELAQDQEVEQMRNRGWLPPGVKRQFSFRQRLSTRKEKIPNPFLGGKHAKKQQEDENPFVDPNPSGADEEEEEGEVDDFFELERPDNADATGVEMDKPNGRVTLFIFGAVLSYPSGIPGMVKI